MSGHARSLSATSMPRQHTGDSYFPSVSRSSGIASRRRQSNSVQALDPSAPTPPTPQPMGLTLRDIGSPMTEDSEFDGGGGAPPSPSTLTDIILTLHASLYGAKRSAEEIKEMVWRYYDSNAVFDSPFVSAHGSNRIIDQFMMAFSLPGLDVRSELRDVICSDFEFDGTRAGIIDHTVTVTFFPNIFGRPRQTPLSGRFTPGPLASQGSITPHPFLNYPMSSGDHHGPVRRRTGMSYVQSPLTPSTPFLNAPTSASGSNSMHSSRPRTPGWVQESSLSAPGLATSNGALDSSPVQASRGDSVPMEALPEQERHEVPPLAALSSGMPQDAVKSHWTAPQGLGRRPLWVLIYDILHPLEILRAFFSVELRIFSRLEFNEAGRIVRHEDTWSVRELVDGTLPFLSLFYNLQRFLTGLFMSWLIHMWR